MKVINTTRGIRRESTDLELVQKRFPSVRAGNDRAYFMHITGDKWSAFLIGKIDGLADKMIFELKHRQSRLFHEFRTYEQVQCMLYNFVHSQYTVVRYPVPGTQYTFMYFSICTHTYIHIY